MLYCFSTSISDIQAKTKVMTAQTFWALEDPCCRCIWLQGYWFRAQKQIKINSHLFFCFLPNVMLFFNSDIWCSSKDKVMTTRFSTKCCVVFQLRSLMFNQRQRWWQHRLCELWKILAGDVKASRILIQSSEMEGKFHSFFSFVQCFVTISWENI